MRAICKISYFYKIAYCALAPTSYDSLLDTPIFRGLNAFSGFFAHAAQYANTAKSGLLHIARLLHTSACCAQYAVFLDFCLGAY